MWITKEGWASPKCRKENALNCLSLKTNNKNRKTKQTKEKTHHIQNGVIY